jgi:hypothetical protein
MKFIQHVIHLSYLLFFSKLLNTGRSDQHFPTRFENLRPASTSTSALKTISESSAISMSSMACKHTRKHDNKNRQKFIDLHTIPGLASGLTDELTDGLTDRLLHPFHFTEGFFNWIAHGFFTTILDHEFEV